MRPFLLPRTAWLATLALTCVVGLGAFYPAQSRVVSPVSLQQSRGMVSRFYYQIALEAGTLGQLDFSSDLMGRVYRLNPDNLHVVMNYAQLLQGQHKLEEALIVYQRLLAQTTDPDIRAVLLYQSALLYDDLNRLPEAIESLTTSINLITNQVPGVFYYNLGVFHAKLNQFEESRIYSQKAVERVPESAAAWNNLAYSFAKLGRYEEGYDSIQHSLHIEPRNANALDSLGYILYHLGRYDEAIETYQKALSEDPLMAESMLYLGLAYEAKNQLSKAIEALERFVIVSDDPKQTAEIQGKIARLKSKVADHAWSPPLSKPGSQVSAQLEKSLPGVSVDPDQKPDVK